MSALDYIAVEDALEFDLRVRGAIPESLSGSLIIPTNRRPKDRGRFSRWHDSQTDMLRLDLYPGRPGRVRAHVLPIDSSGADVAPDIRAVQREVALAEATNA